MLVHLATAYPTEWSYLPRFLELARQDRFKTHRLTDDPTTADVILFVDARHEHGDWLFKALRDHELSRRFPEKCFVYNETDQPWCCMPGLYVGMPARWFQRGRMRASSYLGLMNPFIETEAASFHGEPDYLFSFAGRRCAPVREHLLRLCHPRALIEDTSHYNFFGSADRPPQEMNTQKHHYAQMLVRTKFVLCPRGSGPASFRLFEAMAAGRVPVILSDEWVPVEGPDWSQCSIQIRENDADRIPELLEAAESKFAELAAAAKATWIKNFAQQVIFHRMVEACIEIKATRPIPESIARRLPDLRQTWLRLRRAKAAIRSALRHRSVSATRHLQEIA